MSTGKHTPGPWRVGRHLGARSDVRLIHKDAGDKGQGIPIIEGVVSLEDARLIAAAPELLSALERLLMIADVCDAAELGALKQARAAIAKAEGQS